jgi:UDP-glucose 4-epimerase
MPDKKVLVTGGAGFIGSHVVDRLVSDDFVVRVIDNLSTGKLANISQHLGKGAVDFIEADIRDFELVRKCVHGVDAVIHLAAITSVPFSVKQPEMTFETNVTGTLNLLNCCLEAETSQLVFISSCAVYGEPKYLPVDELHPAKPISPYAESKLLGERHCLAFHKKYTLKSVILRLFNVYGPRQGVNDYSGVITKFIDRIKQKMPLVIYGDGSQSRDLARLNLGLSHKEPRAGDIKNTFANISKAEKLLGYKPAFSLQNGLRALFFGRTQSQIVDEVFSR